jgi:hypothetical protein
LLPAENASCLVIGSVTAVIMMTGVFSVRGSFAQPFEHFEPVHAGHHDVEDDDVRQGGAEERDDVGPA